MEGQAGEPQPLRIPFATLHAFVEDLFMSEWDTSGVVFAKQKKNKFSKHFNKFVSPEISKLFSLLLPRGGGDDETTS